MKEKILTLLSAAALAVCLLSVAVFLPARTEETTPAAAELSGRFSRQISRLLSDAVEGYAYIPKHYRIPEGALPAAPAESGYGESADPAEIAALIEAASRLLGEETVLGWTPETELAPGSTVQYYYDETLLVLTWQEEDERRILTWCEVKLADPSQLRRKLSGDEYGCPIQLPASVLAAQDNAVAAISGDFYTFREAGVHVYNSALYHVSGSNADTCMFDAEGNLHIVHRGELTSWGQAAAYIREKDIVFSAAFGPSVLENGQITVPYGYEWGENQNRYARALLSQVGELHYLFLAANASDYTKERYTAAEAAQLMLDKGCTMAYAMDGGQTAELVFRGCARNTPEAGWERPVSDVICFASALPAGGGA